MISLARKNLFAEKTRLLISIGGVALSVLIILVILSLYQGWKTLISDYIKSVDADFWVAQEGSADMFHSVSILPSNLEKPLSQVGGVSQVQRLLARQVVLDVKGNEAHLRLMGYDTASGVGGPPGVVSGQAIPGSGEIIADRVFVQNNKLSAGDEISITGNALKLVGVSSDGNYIFAQLAFLPIEDAERILEMADYTNFFLVKAEEGEDLQTVKERIEDSLVGVTAVTKDEFIEINEKLIVESFLPIIAVLVFISFLVGVAVIGLTVYTATIEKSREYGILKAIGARNSYLYRTIIAQSLISGVLGFVLGVALAYVANYTAAYFVPEFITNVRLQDVVYVFGAAVAMSILASYIPIRRIAQIDPMQVFKS